MWIKSNRSFVTWLNSMIRPSSHSRLRNSQRSQHQCLLKLRLTEINAYWNQFLRDQAWVELTEVNAYRSQLSEVKAIHSVSGQSNECDAIRVHRSTSALFFNFVCFLSLLLFCIHIGVRLAFVFLCCVSIVHHLLYSRRAPTQESRYLGETPMWMEILTSILWGCFVHFSMN